METTNSMHRFQKYQILAENRDAIIKEFKRIADDLDTKNYRSPSIGMLGGSGTPPVLGKRIREAMDRGSEGLVKLNTLDDQIRGLVKDNYGDDYDAVTVSSAEAGLWVTFDALVSPPLAVRGDKYISSYLAALERHTHHQAAYGSPFPPYLKDHTADRGVTAGELGILGKRLENTRVNFVRSVGARYENHGIKFMPAFMMLETDGAATAEKFRKMADRSDNLAAVVSIGYDSPGYGYGDKGPNGSPVLQNALGDLAAELDIPYIVDNARGTPFLGFDPRETGGSIVIYSADKAFGGPTAGLIIGKEQYMTTIRRAVGTQGQRWGTLSSHGKAGYVMVDPGKEGLLAVLAALEGIIENPKELIDPVETLFELTKSIAAEELGALVDQFEITTSRNSLAVEVNYQRTWDGDTPIPIFSIEDFYAGSNLLQYGLAGARIGPPLCYDGNIIIGPLSNLCDTDGVLNEERAGFTLRTLFRGLVHLGERFNST